MKMNPVVHFELPADNMKRMSQFYEKAFGWKTKQLGKEMGEYVLATTTETGMKGPVRPGAINGGFYQRKEDGTPVCPSFVISVDDINMHMKTVNDAGGKVIGEPVEVPGVGMFVSFKDTEGNSLSMLQPNEMPKD